MDYKDFKETLKEFIKIKEIIEELNVVLKKFEKDFNYICLSRYDNLIVSVLKKAMNDKYNWIEYFLYERNAKFTNKKIITDKDGKNLPFRNYKDLYNLIKYE